MSGSEQGAGPATMRGLAWLARVGPAPVQAWSCAMGWNTRRGFSQAQVLERLGCLQRHPTVRGQGSLLLVTRAGVATSGLALSPAPAPAPMWWAHLRACAWVAAWLSIRGRQLQGPREVIADESWRGELRWSDQQGRHKRGHCPDLAWLTEGARVALEVELAAKRTARLEAILALHARWRAAGASAGVIYVCADEHGRERIRAAGARQGLGPGRGGLHVDLLAEVEREALQAWSSRPRTGARR